MPIVREFKKNDGQDVYCEMLNEKTYNILFWISMGKKLTEKYRRRW
jgi:hypothetical protein